MKTPDNTTLVPPLDKRIETGPLQFGDDWPGVFFRGDDALFMAGYLALALQHVPDQAGFPVKQLLMNLRDTLQSCSVGDTGWPP